MKDPIAIIVPHAGLIYSGQISADAYRQVMGRDYDVFVILGVNHTTGGFSGISLADYQSFRTPLGDVKTDGGITEALLARCGDCVLSREVHAGEHSIEVQLPFIQVLFPDTKIVPVIIHPPDPALCARFGKVLAEVLKDKKALIIISSDLSHYPSSEDAAAADRTTLEAIASLNPEKIRTELHKLDKPKLDTRACGEAGILSGIEAARLLGASRAIISGYANSGNTITGDRTRTVGYGAVVLTSEKAPSDLRILNQPKPGNPDTALNEREKKLLLDFARKTLDQYLTTQTLPLARKFPPRLNARQGAFVTLKKHGQLRGCIGNMSPDEELGKTVGRVALLAALKDPRFKPLEREELESLEIEISVLSPMKPVKNPEQIVIGRDGVHLTKDGHSAVFLPQVAPENNWNRSELLEHLCLKAQLPSGCWRENARLKTFQADVFSEEPGAGSR